MTGVHCPIEVHLFSKSGENEILCFQVNLMNIGNLLDLLTFTNEGIKLKFHGFQGILFSLNELYNFVKVFRVSILI